MIPKKNLCLLVGIAWVLAGCGKPSLVGDWSGTVQGQTITTNFGQDGNFKGSIKGEQMKVKFEIDVSGTWKIEENRLILDTKKVTPKNLPKALRTVFDASVRPNLVGIQTLDIRWRGKDTLEVTPTRPGTEPYTMTRVK